MTEKPKRGHAHRQVRASWLPAVEAGKVICWRCGKRIMPGTPWDMGHDDRDLEKYSGPEHAFCSRSAGSLKKQGRLAEAEPPRFSRRW